MTLDAAPQETVDTVVHDSPAPDQSSAISSGNEIPFNEAMPEKFRVFDGEGDQSQFNLEASSKKLLESYTALEKRGGAPESPDDYTVDPENISEGFNFDEFKQDETNQAFLKSMHAAGLNNGQVEKVLSYGMKELIPGLMQGNQALSADSTIEHLKNEVWTDPGQYEQNIGMAHRAYSSLPEDLQNEINNAEQAGGAIGNHPVFNKVMALFGKEMREDTPPSESAGMGEAVEIEKLMSSDAYKNPKNPEHKDVSKTVQNYFQKKYSQKA